MPYLFTDHSGLIQVIDLDDYRQGPPAARFDGLSSTRRRRRRGRGQPIVVHQQPPPTPWGQPIPYYGPQPAPYYGQPAPAPAPTRRGHGLDMRGALEAVGALLPATGKVISAFRKAPDRPKLTGDPQKDMTMIVEFVAENFDHARSGAQTAGVPRDHRRHPGDHRFPVGRIAHALVDCPFDD